VTSDDVFSALSNPVRRRVLELLLDGPMTAGSIAEEFDLSRPAVSEHLRVLRLAGLVHEQPSGRERHYRLAAEPLRAVGAWLHPFERYWRDRLRTLADVLEEEEEAL
jgi:DNA-binding transcriptional ArsR family regulator